MGDEYDALGTGELVIRWLLLKRLLEQMDTVGGQSAKVLEFVTGQVFNADAFHHNIPGTDVFVLQPLYDGLSAVGSKVGTALTEFDKKWADLTAGIVLSAKDFETSEGHVVQAWLDAYVKLAEAAKAS